MKSPLFSCSSSDDESLVTSCRCVVSLSVSTSPEQPTFLASLEISSILLSFTLLSILKEIVRDSIWASIRPNSSSVVWEGDWARTGGCTLDIGAVANGRFIESDESVSSVKSVWYNVQFWWLSNAGVPIFTCFPYLTMVFVTGGCVASQYWMFQPFNTIKFEAIACFNSLHFNSSVFVLLRNGQCSGTLGV